MEVVILGQRIGGHNLSHIELQSVQHHAGVGVGLSSLRHGAVGDDNRLALGDVERDERHAGFGIATSRRSELHTRCRHLPVDADLNVGLRLVLVRIIVVSLQRMLSDSHTRNGQDERGGTLGNLCQVATLQIGGQHLVGNNPQAVRLHVGLVPVAAHILCGASGSDGDGHTVFKGFRVAFRTGHSPRDVVYLCVLTGGSLSRQVEINVLGVYANCHSGHTAEE